ncbi:uncharacterized protein LOC143290167 [Babylonia areolata]|uniref:uncharacterized protein LOC143290167 n=1 Tax=Babylonia areolata TaxID=304850 RepID=UPI003FD1D2EB
MNRYHHLHHHRLSPSLCCLLLLLVTCVVVVTSSGEHVQPEKRQRGGSMECTLCKSRCTIRSCVCINLCIRGTGNDCIRYDPQEHRAGTRKCVEDCRDKNTSCLRGNCDSYCPSG